MDNANPISGVPIRAKMARSARRYWGFKKYHSQQMGWAIHVCAMKKIG
jgi:hypothetical protein